MLLGATSPFWGARTPETMSTDVHDSNSAHVASPLPATRQSLLIRIPQQGSTSENGTAAAVFEER